MIVKLINKKRNKIRRRKWASGTVKNTQKEKIKKNVNESLELEKQINQHYKLIRWGQKIDGKPSTIVKMESNYGRLCPNCKAKLVATASCGYCGWTKEGKKQRSRRIPKAVQREVWRRDGGRCVECGSRERLEYDHIIPFSKGGSNTVRNIELLCEKCNRNKHNII